MIILTGPRQVGKTWLAKALMPAFRRPQYLNYDQFDDQRITDTLAWALDTDMLILDEVHKKSGWKRFVKGIYDTRPEKQAILITGSSRLDTFRQSGESLAGRYFHFRLNPLSVRELEAALPPFEALTQLNRLGGFPEPFLSGQESQAARWRNQYYTDLIREDILEFGRVQEIRSMRLLLELLRERVGSPLSYASLARDLQLATNTVRRYVEILEDLCIIFAVRPFHLNIARAVLREPKVYFYDSGFLKADEGIRLENSCAVCLLKHVQYLHDALGEEADLHYLRTKDGQEIDFALSRKGKIEQLIEVKLSDDVPSAALHFFRKRIPDAKACLLVHNLRREQQREGVSIFHAGPWLARLSA